MLVFELPDRATDLTLELSGGPGLPSGRGITGAESSVFVDLWHIPAAPMDFPR